MRKLAVVLFAIGSLCLMAVPAFAGQGDMAFGVIGGMTMPMGCLADEDEANMKSGLNLGGSFDYFVTKDLALGLDASYGMMTSEDDEDVKGKTLQFGVHGKYMVPTGGQFVPYLSAGLGMYNRKVDFSDEVADFLGLDESSFSDNVFGMNFGVGAEYKVTPTVGIGVNGAYHYTLGEFKPEVDGEEVTLLDDWTYMVFNAGVTFYFPMSK